MTAGDHHLAKLAAVAEMMRHGQTIQQIGAICFRINPEGKGETLLITTRETGRWTIPKGWPIKGLKPHEVAEREAWEEAGVKGKARKKPFGYFTYIKILEGGIAVPAMVEVHLLDVTKTRDKFPECGQRLMAWLSLPEAATRVQEPELKSLLMGLANRAAA